MSASTSLAREVARELAPPANKDRRKSTTPRKKTGRRPEESAAKGNGMRRAKTGKESKRRRPRKRAASLSTNADDSANALPASASDSIKTIAPDRDPALVGTAGSSNLEDEKPAGQSALVIGGGMETASAERGWTRLLRFLAEKWMWTRTQVKVRRVKKRLRVCETVSLGEKRFVAVIQVDGEQFLVGGSANSVSTLARLERPPEFAEVLEQRWAGDPARA